MFEEARGRGRGVNWIEVEARLIRRVAQPVRGASQEIGT